MSLLLGSAVAAGAGAGGGLAGLVTGTVRRDAPRVRTGRGIMELDRTCLTPVFYVGCSKKQILGSSNNCHRMSAWKFPFDYEDIIIIRK